MVNAVTLYSIAELYNPTTGEFTETGPLPRPASYGTATLLSDGKVLLADGFACKDAHSCVDVPASTAIEPLQQAELYDPVTGKFSPTGSLAYDHGPGPTATLLPDGRVLIAGWVPTAELYDPATGKFTPTGQETAFNGNLTATLLPNGKVLVTGDDSASNFVAQLYDEKTGKFTTISLPIPPGSATYEGQTIERPDVESAVLLKDGFVLLFEYGYLQTYDPVSGRCADAGYISPAGEWDDPTVTLLPDGEVLFQGGYFTDSQHEATTNAALLYDPSDGHVRAATSIAARQYGTATLLADGRVLIAGGEDNDGNPLNSAELFVP